jgi:outer membrane protein assembly factor BamC
MKRMLAKPAAITLLISTVFLGACSTVIEGDKVDYKSAGTAPPLSIPPDLTKIAADPRYAVPSSGSVTASGYEGRNAAPTSVLPASIGDIRVERQGNQRWLVVSRPPEKIWDTVADFWKDSGFILLTEDKTVGIMETDWAENRAKIPQDFIRQTLGKLLDALYSTAERDKFRTRIERTSNGQTEIFISHRGMQEVDKKSGVDSTTVWTPRASDPELEAEFVRRLMIKLGASVEQSKTAIATSPTSKNLSEVVTENGRSTLRIAENFDRAWRRVGLSLDRTGFTVEDRDRTKGLYYVRYVESAISGKESEQGFFSRMFGKSPASNRTPVKYQIAITGKDQISQAIVLTEKGAPETSAVAAQILTVLAADLK